MASARKTATNENISTYGVSRNYTSFATWEAATDIDLVTGAQSEVLECYDDAASFAEGNVTFGGATVNTSYFRIVRPASGNRHDGTPNNGFTIVYTGDTNGLTLSEQYFCLEDLIYIHNVNSATLRIAIVPTSSNVFVTGMLVKATNAGTGGARGYQPSNTAQGRYFIDCLAYECKDYGFFFNSGATKIDYAYNCTAYNCGAGFYGFANTGGTVVLTNCLSTANTGADFARSAAGVTMTVTYCASEDATADDWGGAGNRISQTFTFVNTATDDYHLGSADAGAKDYGTDLSGTFDDDIDFVVRTGSWDIGFDEYVSAGGTVVKDFIMSGFIPFAR